MGDFFKENVTKVVDEKNVDVTTTPIEIIDGVQVNYELDEMKMNLFSIFGNSDEIKILYELLYLEIETDDDDNISLREGITILLSFDDNGSIKLSFPNMKTIKNMEKISDIIGRHADKYKEFPLENKLDHEITNFYEVFKSYCISYLCNILINSNLIPFLKTIERQIECYISCNPYRPSISQVIHTDDTIFVSLTYTSDVVLSPEIIFVPRQISKVSFRDRTDIYKYKEKDISIPANMDRIFQSINTIEKDYFDSFKTSPVLRFDISKLKYPTITFCDFALFHATPHTDDITENNIIKNMEAFIIDKDYTFKRINPTLKSCRGRECIKQSDQPEFRQFTSISFNLSKNIDVYTDEHYHIITITAEQLSRFVKPDIQTLTLTPDTFVGEINQILETGKLPGNISARGGKKQQRKNTNYYKKKSKKIIKKNKSNKSNKSKKYKKSIKK